MRTPILATFLCLMLTSGNLLQGQNSPVKWKFSSRKIADKVYEVRMQANIGFDWHIYSQFTEEGGPFPTTFTFNKNPIVSLDGKILEEGELNEYFEKAFGINVQSFKDSVLFIQRVKLKSKVVTTLNGTVEFMACTDERCLPPEKVSFSLKLDE